MNKKWPLIFLPLFLHFHSCCYTLQCQKINMAVSFISFSSSELDTIVFRRYQVNSSYQVLLDSVFVEPFKLPSTFIRDDTAHLFTAGSEAFQVGSTFDYEIWIPGANKLVRVSDIIEKKSEQKVCFSLDRTQCYNEITQYKIDGLLKTGPALFINK